MQDDDHSHAGRGTYWSLAVNILVSLVIMYFVMFAMIDGSGDFFHNLNMGYMAMMMAAPMGPLMLLTMPAMYPSRRLNLALHLAFLAAFLLAFAAIRLQGAIGDEQFVRSMIPHHSGAILMCREADLADAELAALCQDIIAAQRTEIEQMRTILDRL
ncbi:DUF305 domain-containing protein [Devosia sp. YIM 151766]|uniref:DUF305 domain-containing protein n=1 Tax=Devosia sp. YIM 151766 TaxID=3017325 RepID=UPI00255C4937|nr:DUF305 domain-containing protein [Devosia sp. YIM 151766]WIY52344.1 DUF305 domain-containing protein [Devosia sp. YIM 151766]